MSSDLISIQLTRIERLNINAHKKLGSKWGPNRLVSIDWFKGFAIFWIISAHLAPAWLGPQQMWYYRIIFLFLGYLGPSTFLFFAGVNTTLSYRMGQANGIPHNKIFLDTARRMVGLLVISIAMNVINIGNLESTPPSFISYFLRWDILQTIAISVIITFPLLTTSIPTRLCIAGAMLAGSFPLYLLFSSNSSLLNQSLDAAFFYPFLDCPLLPMAANTIIGMVVIDMLLPITQQRHQRRALEGSKGNFPNSTKNFKILFLGSVLVILFSIVLGAGPVPNTDPTFLSEASHEIQELHTNPIFNSWAYVPQFLIQWHPLNVIFEMGQTVFSFLLPFYYFEIYRAVDRMAGAIPSKSVQIVAFWGQFSFSFFAWSYIIILLPLYLNPVTLWIGVIAALIGLSLLFKFLLRKWHGAGMVEWVMLAFALNWTEIPPLKDIGAVYPTRVANLKN